MRTNVGVLLLFLCSVAGATKPANHPAHPLRPVHTEHHSDTVANSSAVAHSDVAVGAASLTVGGDRTTAIALGNTAPIPLHATPACYLPAKGIKRIRRVLFGAVDFDPRLIRDEACYAALIQQREHDLALIEAQAKLEQAKADRIKAETGANLGK